MTDKDHLTRQDEDLASGEFTEEERVDDHRFGNWPEIFGAALLALLCWLTFGFTG